VTLKSDSIEKKARHKTYMRKWRKENEKHLREYTRRYVRKNAKRIRELANARYKKNPFKKREASLRFKRKHPHYQAAHLYGISHELALSLRNGTCGICGKRGTKRKPLHVDHCHRSKKVRGSLCGRCNSALGFLKDRVDLLKNAIRYLKRNGVRAK
jgi:hypothetical protein